MTPNLTAFTGVDSQNLPDVMVSVQFILAIGDKVIILNPSIFFSKNNSIFAITSQIKTALT
ncbi:hypothetical protein [Lactobacillus delbrueckii]|uniref:hypothetical protein n=1 Tax=Lactobacillus delbrueckii TaxID=1584 RepID=UPI001A9843FC|nr:hypothetical protein [Lactobacillus delbrueckii]MBO1185551.1 hypothetical protein [Lactobacillus delbrueckii subsp. lactis]